jgi:hypothetical protein
MKPQTDSSSNVSNFSADDLKKITAFFSILIRIDQKNKAKERQEKQ